jgi:hypothetical protein
MAADIPSDTDNILSLPETPERQEPEQTSFTTPQTAPNPVVIRESTPQDSSQPPVRDNESVRRNLTNLFDEMVQSKYYSKYLKYKNKYLLLKNKSR